MKDSSPLSFLYGAILFTSFYNFFFLCFNFLFYLKKLSSRNSSNLIKVYVHSKFLIVLCICLFILLVVALSPYGMYILQVRHRLRRDYGIEGGVPVVFSLEKPKAKLLPFKGPSGDDENPSDYQVRMFTCLLEFYGAFDCKAGNC